MLWHIVFNLHTTYIQHTKLPIKLGRFSVLSYTKISQHIFCAKKTYKRAYKGVKARAMGFQHARFKPHPPYYIFLTNIFLIT